MRKFPEVRAVFFDAVGTLLHPDPPAVQVYAEVGLRYGSRLSLATVTRRFAAAFRQEEEVDRLAGWRTDEERELHRWRTIVATVLDDVNDGRACFAELYEHFGRPDAWSVEPEAALTLKVLVARGYLVGMASNYDWRLRRVLAGLPELNTLKTVVVSSEVGWRKPAAEFYNAAIRSVGLAPRQILFVGDDGENDYEGARAAGCPALLFAPRIKEPELPDRITALSEMLGFLA